MRLLALGLLLFTACGFLGPTIAGSGAITKAAREVESFDQVSLAGHADLSIQVGAPDGTCEVECDDNLQEFIEVSVENRKLQIKFRDNVRLSPTQGIRIYVATPELKSVELAGTSQTEIKGLAEPASLSVEGAGSHKIACSGSLDSLSVKLAGSCKLLAQDVVARKIDLEMAGSAAADVHATESLNVEVAGSGKVEYTGDPKVTQSIVGAGRIEKKSE